MTAITEAEGRDQVAGLVEKFTANRTFYKTAAYKETATRAQFIDPFFRALGWDVTDADGRGPSREVLLENLHRSEAELAGSEDWDEDLTAEELAERTAVLMFPDYVFRLDFIKKFVTEAKKPSVDLHSKVPTFQAKSYGWSMGVAVAVLTDFEAFRVFDARFKPAYGRPNDAILDDLDLTCDQYVAEWPRIWSLLSRDAVLGGSLDQLVAPRRGTMAVDKSLVTELLRWRGELAQELLTRNPTLTRFDLAEATQRILDRLVFIRIMEDRGILGERLLRRHARLTDSYAHMVPVFHQLDVIYNGQIFAPHFSDQLTISDSVIQRIVSELQPPAPYRFDGLPTDVLGSIYERFLGQEIVVEGSSATLEDKLEVRHAGGVYYTPRWVAEHIVDRVLSPLLAGKTRAPSRI